MGAKLRFNRQLSRLSVADVAFAVCVLAIIFIALGHLYNQETVTVLVTGTETVIDAGENSTDISYIVHTDGEKFNTTWYNYDEIQTGKKHTFVVTGWKHFRYIVKVLE